MKTAVVVFSTHLKLDSISVLKNEVNECERIVFVTPQYVFDNEREIISNIFDKCLEYVCFADLMTDEDGAKCDSDAFIPYQESGRLALSDMYSCFGDMNIMKNEILADKINKLYTPDVKLIMSNDLGICLDVWINNGYKRHVGDYYIKKVDGRKVPLIRKIFRRGAISKIMGRMKNIPKKLKINYPDKIYVSNYNGKKILFHGHLERAGYRINLKFETSTVERFKLWLVKLLYVLFRIRIDRNNVINMTTLHEYGNYAYYDMIDIPEFHNYLFQDGYLPPNDTCKYLFFYGRNSHFLSWDKLGNKVFEYHGIPVSILPCRNIFPLPKPIFRPIKKILCVSSGAGDWTAIKNRSDEDKTVVAFVEMAKRYPNITFMYRCHPSWVGSGIQGVNSIQRVVEYFDWLKLPNIHVSSNIPSFVDSRGNVVVSHRRSSLETDLKEADFVFGVHSISMIDGAMDGIPFASVNLSGRRNLWQGITDLGFPHCENIEAISEVIESVLDPEFQSKYCNAIDNYNKIINEK